MTGRVVEGSSTVSVVVAVRGNPTAAPGLVAAIQRQTFPVDRMELIIVDNHGRPALADALGARVPFQHRLVHEPRPGLSRARNAGIRQARGDYIVITDVDARPDRQWVEQLVTALVETGAFCAGGRTLVYLTDISKRMPDPRLLTWFVPPQWPDQVMELRAPYWLVGCNLASRRTDPPTLFAEDLGVVGGRHRSCEDLEFVARAQASGHRVVVAPDAVVWRAVHPSDLKWRSMVARALWHGVSMARLVAAHPDADVYDSYRLIDTFGTTDDVASWLLSLGRIAGYRVEQGRLVVRARRPLTVSRRSPVSGNPGMKEADRDR